MRKLKCNVVFACALVISVVIACIAILCPKTFKFISDNTFSYITTRFGWLYLIAMFGFVVFIIYIALSKYGNIRLGDSKPEYSNFSWFAMLFCAGMGVGLVFWGISEPISHYINPGQGIESKSVDSIGFAFKSVFMHWGIHPWAAYCIVGLSLAYFQYKKGKSALISSTLESLFKNQNMPKIIKNIVDVLATFATIAGIVTSLGLGVMQINSGLKYVFGIPYSQTVQVIIILVTSIVFVASAVSGIEKGVKFLSNATLIMMLAIMVLCFCLGAKLEIVDNLIGGIGDYFQNFIGDSLCISTYKDSSWIINWRVFYWAWWIAWTPFVGIFIARISRGRTIREFICGVVLAPTVASIIWFSIFGTMGIHLAVDGTLSSNILDSIASNPEIGLFVVFAKYPFAIGTSIIAIVILFSFFVTSADSGTYVLAMLSSNGNVNPSNKKKICWGLILSVMAVSLLFAGGLKALQTISIVAAFPFVIIMIASCFSLVKDLRAEKKNG